MSNPVTGAMDYRFGTANEPKTKTTADTGYDYRYDDSTKGGGGGRLMRYKTIRRRGKTNRRRSKTNRRRRKH